MINPQQHPERLDQLATFLREPAIALITAIQRDLTMIMFISYTWRSAATQRGLYEQGRAIDRETGLWAVTNESLIVTNAPPGTSPHNAMTSHGAPASLAFDMIPMTSTGHLLWGTSMADWQKIFTYAWKFGFDPLGDTIGAHYAKDLCHFEEPNWKQKLQGLGLVLSVSTGSQTV